MAGRREIGRKQGPVAALFVLFGLLLNVATATGAQLDRDPSATRLGSGEMARTASGALLASRTDEDGVDRDDALAALPPTPKVVALDTSSYPSGASGASATLARTLEPFLHYRARAPPAA